MKKIKMKNIKILDCTLRDGGYYNNWEFSHKLINEYLKIISKQKIDFVELGFRTLKKNITGGVTASTSDKFINKLKIPHNLKVGVMINASDFFKSSEKPIQLCNNFFTHSKKCKISFIRLACHIHDIYKIKNVVSWFKNKNYKVFLNIMQISEISDQEIKKISFFLNKLNIDVLYLADSLGSITPTQTKKLYSKFQKYWKGEMGLHAHDNLGLALKNCKSAVSCNVNWIDGTVTGMGRGPGNVKTEDLIKSFYPKSNSNKLKKLIKRYFQPMKEKYRWGKNKYYELAAKNKIHPTYIQDLLSDTRYKEKDYLNIINILKKTDSRQFNPFQMYSTEILFSGKPKGKWNPKTQLNEKNILILGPGTSVKKKKKSIEKIIKQKNLLVLAINTATPIDEKLINLRVVCHPMRIMSDSFFHSTSRKGLVIPYSMMPNKIKNIINIDNKLIYDFGISINLNNKVIIKDKYCILPKPLAISYALSLAIAGNARRIYLAGFDGFDNFDPFKDETNIILKYFKQTYKKLSLKTLTTSKYNLEKVLLN
ncbi:hypothetical protein OAB48_00800 [Pelagibacteraceae bacterium]|nr:hypothetical protein [Pelagibacteraceae bacterium]